MLLKSYTGNEWKHSVSVAFSTRIQPLQADDRADAIFLEGLVLVRHKARNV